MKNWLISINLNWIFDLFEIYKVFSKKYTNVKIYSIYVLYFWHIIKHFITNLMKSYKLIILPIKQKHETKENKD